ncbi:iron ABC transporter permease [Pseudoalteromonas haloplanktis]|uniref:Iron ABC transporter permease n=1 Tax=Pseudoalteromonas haloplanktis TaxID=228 RepID=A0ABU1B7L1_PSEHA|nr:iron ABC transporter permease [Pseudoalteromonas haloplanktis]MDQ9090217.1 iron ABC transporter permease [Pseudoalteromonas haloplanktis]
MLALGSTLITQQQQRRFAIPALFIACIVMFFIALSKGGVTISISEIIAIINQTAEDQLKHAIIWQIRLPRIVLAMIVGAGLAACGAAMQAIFRNPLADPGLIGVSSGAALGAVATIVLGTSIFANFSDSFGIYAVPVGAFLGCIGVCVFIYRLSAHSGQFTIISLLLAGIAVNAIVGSLIGVLTLISNDQQLRDLTLWSMGSLAGNHFAMMTPTLCIIIACCIGLLRLAKPLNLYLLGEAQAKHLGINVTKLKKQVFIYTALCTGAAVAITGIIGFVGFIVPHIVRLILGPDHRYLIPASILGGALMLGLADLFARTVILPAEVPIGLITSAIGGPFFLIMLLKTYQQRG